MLEVDERWITAKELAEYLHIHVNTVKRISAEELPYLQFGSRGDRRYRRADVELYIRARMAR